MKLLNNILKALCSVVAGNFTPIGNLLKLNKSKVNSKIWEQMRNPQNACDVFKTDQLNKTHPNQKVDSQS